MGSNNQFALENAVQDYAHDLFATDVKAEFEYQIGEWKKYINRIIDAEKAASKSQEDLLTAVLNERQKADQANAMIAMFAFSLLGGAALSWVSGLVQYKLFPALNSSNFVMKERLVFLRNQYSKRYAEPAFMYSNEAVPNNIMAKIFGDASKNLLQPLVNSIGDGVGKIPARGKGRSSEELTALSLISKNANSDAVSQSLKTRLENALEDEKQLTTKTILALALEIKRSQVFGKNVLAYLYKTQPQAIKANDQSKMQLARQFIEKIVDAQRQKWAETWFYYGNEPPNPSVAEMSRRLEREIWGMWILDQEYKVKKVEIRDSQDDVLLRVLDVVEGRHEIPFHRLIVNRLIDLGVILPQTSRQFKELNERNSGSQNRERPNVLVSENLDTQKELTEIQDWAKTHPPEFISGHLDGSIRMLESIIHVHL